MIHRILGPMTTEEALFMYGATESKHNLDGTEDIYGAPIPFLMRGSWYIRRIHNGTRRVT